MDYYKDAGHLFAKIFHDQELPDFVKSGEIEDRNSLAALPDTAFADQQQRLFPIHDRGHVFMSAAYAAAGNDQAALSTIEKAASAFGIKDAVDEIKAHVQDRLSKEANQKTASVAIRNEFEIPCGDSTLKGRSDATLQKAAEFFLSNRSQLSFDDRVKCASALLKEAADRGIEIPSLESQAGQGGCDLARYKAAALCRGTFIIGEGDRSQFTEMVHSINEKSTTPDLLKAAAYLDHIDTVYSLARFYGVNFPEPMETVFNISRKEANLRESKVRIGVKEFGRDRWQGGNFDMWQQALEHALGKTAAAEMFVDGEPVQSKFAALDEKQSDLLLRYLG